MLFRSHLTMGHIVHRLGVYKVVLYSATVTYITVGILIELHNRMSSEDYIITLLHELQHILQHVRGDLRDKRGIRCWKGLDCSELDYENSPWELEAHSMEQVLYQDYLTSL